MGYYMRFIMTDGGITLPELHGIVQRINPAYTLQPDEVPDLADILYDNQRIAQLEINHPDEDIFEDDISEFKDLVGVPENANAQKVLDALNSATALIAIESFWEEGKADETLDKLDPLWDWLLTNRKGIVQADGEGFYDASGLLIERNFTL